MGDTSLSYYPECHTRGCNTSNSLTLMMVMAVVYRTPFHDSRFVIYKKPSLKEDYLPTSYCTRRLSKSPLNVL